MSHFKNTTVCSLIKTEKRRNHATNIHNSYKTYKWHPYQVHNVHSTIIMASTAGVGVLVGHVYCVHCDMYCVQVLVGHVYCVHCHYLPKIYTVII